MSALVKISESLPSNVADLAKVVAKAGLTAGTTIGEFISDYFIDSLIDGKDNIKTS